MGRTAQVFSVENEAHSGRFAPFGKLPNKQLLWHAAPRYGTDISQF